MSHLAKARVPRVLAIDAGGTMTDTFIVDESGNIAAKAYHLTKGNPSHGSRELRAQILEPAPGAGTTMTTRGTPATLAGTAFISTDDG